MCGIVGYVGEKQAAPILLEGLKKLEYRGYDSAGVAVFSKNDKIVAVKAKGKLKALSQKTDGGKTISGTCGIGHTRWATHGEPSEINAHPHCNDEKTIFAVHNGIIENYTELKNKLLKKGYSFYSQTDTEVVVKLIDYYYKKYKNGVIDAIAKTMVRVRGSYALEIMFVDHPEQIWVARKDSPMIIGVKDGESFIASDVPAILKFVRNVYYIGNLEMACIKAGEAHFYNLDGDEIKKDVTEITWNAEAAEKEGFEHFMMKEIYEQPEVVGNMCEAFIKDGKVDLKLIGLTDEGIKGYESVQIVGCGSAYHAGIVAQYVMENLAKIPVRVELASEFRYRNPIVNGKTLVVVISQSGETADSLAALREAKERGAHTLAVVNVVGSSVAREADAVLYTNAGPEISVATTKAYSAQLVAGYLLAIGFAFARGVIDDERQGRLVAELKSLPQKITDALGNKSVVQQLAAEAANKKEVFFIGRGLDYALSLEGSLKLKEISYIHSEAYAAGELKHGTISLIEEGTLVISVLTQKTLMEKTVSNMQEVKSRGAHLIAITTVGNFEVEEKSDETIYVPQSDELFMASLALIPTQLFAYYVSVAKGLDVDTPRNLAKSVTVE